MIPRMKNKTKKKAKIFGLTANTVDKNFHEPYIWHGYRKPYLSAVNCMKSVFSFSSNETINVWTHGLPFIVYSMQFYRFFSAEDFHYTDPFNFPLMGNAMGILGFLITSVFAHTFNSMSIKMRNLCFYLDYAAINVYGVGAGLAFFFYTGPIGSSIGILQAPYQYCTLLVCVSVMATVLCCLTRHKWLKFKYVLRTSTFVIPFLAGSFPFLTRLFLCKENCYSNAMPLYFKHTLCYLCAAVFNVTKIPEKYISEKFDVVGHSHNIMHIFVAVGANLQFQSIVMDIADRREFLVIDNLNEYRYLGIPVFMLAGVINFILALWFAASIESDVEKKD